MATSPNKTNTQKAATKRRQRARYRSEDKQSENSKKRQTNLLGGMLKSEDKKVAAIAKLAERRMHHPTQLDPAIASRIVKYILRGHRVITACAAVGVTEATYKRWIAQATEAMAAAEAATDAEAKRQFEELKALEESGDEKALETWRQVTEPPSPFNYIPSSLTVFVHLSQAIIIAEARGEMALMERAASGEKGWQGAMAVLERRHARGWGKTSQLDVNVQGDAERPIVITYEAPEEREKRVAGILMKAGALEGTGREIVDAQDDVRGALGTGEDTDVV